MIVDNFVVHYTLELDKKIVFIIAIQYKRRPV